MHDYKLEITHHAKKRYIERVLEITFESDRTMNNYISAYNADIEKGIYTLLNESYELTPTREECDLIGMRNYSEISFLYHPETNLTLVAGNRLGRLITMYLTRAEMIDLAKECIEMRKVLKMMYRDYESIRKDLSRYKEQPRKVHKKWINKYKNSKRKEGPPPDLRDDIIKLENEVVKIISQISFSHNKIPWRDIK